MIEIPEDATHYDCGKFYCFIDNIPMVYQPEDKKWCLATMSTGEIKASTVGKVKSKPRYSEHRWWHERNVFKDLYGQASDVERHKKLLTLFLTWCDKLDIEVTPDEVKNIKNSWGIKADD